MDADLDDQDVVVRRKLDVHEYHRMGDAGILHEDDRVELIEGELIDMGSIGWDHASTVNGLTRTLVLACGTRAVVSVQNPVRLDEFNEPQPDFAVLKPRGPNGRALGPPGPSEVLLLVEVADSSLRFDKKVKVPLYARFGIPEVWIVDLQKRVLQRYQGPRGGAYGDVTPHGAGESLALAADPKIAVALGEAFD